MLQRQEKAILVSPERIGKSNTGNLNYLCCERNKASLSAQRSHYILVRRREPHHRVLSFIDIVQTNTPQHVTSKKLIGLQKNHFICWRQIKTPFNFIKVLKNTTKVDVYVLCYVSKIYFQKLTKNLLNVLGFDIYEKFWFIRLSWEQIFDFLW